MAPTDETSSGRCTYSTTDGAGRRARRRRLPGRAGAEADRRPESGGCIHADLDGEGFVACRGHPAGKQKCALVKLAACE